MIYLVSLSLRSAVRYTGKVHHMSIRAAAKRFSADAIAIDYCGTGYLGADILKIRSAGQTHLSTTERELIAAVE